MIPTLLIPPQSIPHAVKVTDLPTDVSEAFSALFEIGGQDTVPELPPDAVAGFAAPMPALVVPVSDWRRLPQTVVGVPLPAATAQTVAAMANPPGEPVLLLEGAVTGTAALQLSPAIQQAGAQSLTDFAAPQAVVDPQNAVRSATDFASSPPVPAVPTPVPQQHPADATKPLPAPEAGQAPDAERRAAAVHAQAVPQPALRDPVLDKTVQTPARHAEAEQNLVEPTPNASREVTPTLPQTVPPEGIWPHRGPSQVAPPAQSLIAPATIQPPVTAAEPPSLPLPVQSPILSPAQHAVQSSALPTFQATDSYISVPALAGPRLFATPDQPVDPLAPPPGGPVRVAESALRFVMQQIAPEPGPPRAFLPKTAPKPDGEQPSTPPEDPVTSDDAAPPKALKSVTLTADPPLPKPSPQPVSLEMQKAAGLGSTPLPAVPELITAPAVLSVPRDAKAAPFVALGPPVPDGVPAAAQMPLALDASALPVLGQDSQRVMLFGFDPILPGNPAAAPQPLQASLAPQIAAALPLADDGPVEITLSPAELGRLRIELVTEGDHLRVTVAVERPETLELFRRNSEVLMAEIRQAGFSGAQLSFGNWSEGNSARDAPEPPDDTRHGNALQDVIFAALQPILPARPAHGGGLDLRL